MGSLRRSLHIISLGSTWIVLLLAFLFAYFIIREFAIGELTETLFVKLDTFEAGLHFENDSIEVLDEWPWLDDPNMPLEERVYLQMWDNEQVVFRSLLLETHDLERFPGKGGETDELRWITLPNGNQGLALGIAAMNIADDSPPLNIVIAADASRLTRHLHTLGAWLLGIGFVSAVLQSLILWRGIGRILSPFSTLSAKIEQLDATLPGEGLRVEVHDEVKPVVSQLNFLLARIEKVLDDERAFSNSIAHELRTPLAGLQMKLDVALSRPRSKELLEYAMRDSQDIVRHLIALVARMLEINRLEKGAMQESHDPIDICKLLRHAWTPFEERAANKQIAITWNLEANVLVSSDMILLRQLFTNLFDNSVTYVNEGGHVNVTLHTVGNHVQAHISNTGSTVNSGEAADVFRPFWRADDSRSVDDGHHGIGLTICKRIVGHLNGKISAVSTKGGEFEIVVEIPATIVTA